MSWGKSNTEMQMCAGSEVADSPEAALQRMKKRVYGLSSEVAHLTRERDMLRIQSGQQPGPTLPSGRYPPPPQPQPPPHPDAVQCQILGLVMLCVVRFTRVWCHAVSGSTPPITHLQACLPLLHSRTSQAAVRRSGFQAWLGVHKALHTHSTNWH